MARPSPSAAMRKELRTKIIARLEQLELPRAAAGKTLAMTPAQISRLQGNEDIFSLDRLVDAAVRIGLVVHLSATRPYGEPTGRDSR
jgi:predicted XRE-type DNA-binding protein